jgi:adenosylmethionine-8-amino-7-oxononanoate aminotransferase
MEEPLPSDAELDRRHVWHPYTRVSAAEAGGLPQIVRGEGIRLFDASGRSYVDAISSWWCCALGHGDPAVVAAIRAQAGELQHSILGNLGHPRAAELAARLAGMMPSRDRHVLFASDGASAVEQAMKIAVQHARNRGLARTRFAALRGAYHGDTFGAMSLGYLEAFHAPFAGLLMPADRLPLPHGPHHAGHGGCSCFAPAQAILDPHAGEYAAVVVEPLCLGAAGMHMYPPCWLAALAAWCRAREVVLIVDEIATGFGRTGRMFAFEHAGIDPDIVCVGKALSAGYLPISATIVRDGIYRSFLDTDGSRTLQHGHTFCGNPIAAAAALAALDRYESPGFLPTVEARANFLRDRWSRAATDAGLQDVRSLGLIAAGDLPGADAPRRAQAVRAGLLACGILARPLGSTVYLMPPLVISETDLDALVTDLASIAASVR